MLPIHLLLIDMSLSFEETDDILGKTGQTVVYVFPQGGAYKSRDKNRIFSELDAAVEGQPTLLEAPTVNLETMIGNLVRQGLLTEAQIQVGRYDQESTGLTLLEALAARGWLTQSQVEQYWDQLI